MSAPPPYPLLLVALANSDLRVEILNGLPNFGWRVMTAGSEAEILSLLLQHQPDALLLEAETVRPDSIFLPLHTPSAALVAPGDRAATLHLLRHCQVASCLALPLDLEVLAASLVALLRLQRKPALAAAPGTVPRAADQAGDWQLELTTWTLTLPTGRTLRLTQQEAAFIAALAETPGIAVARKRIIAAMGHDIDYYDPRRLDTLLSRLRNKLAKEGESGLPVRSIHSIGFAFAAPIRVDAGH